MASALPPSERPPVPDRKQSLRFGLAFTPEPMASPTIATARASVLSRTPAGAGAIISTTPDITRKLDAFRQALRRNEPLQELSGLFKAYLKAIQALGPIPAEDTKIYQKLINYIGLLDKRTYSLLQQLNMPSSSFVALMNNEEIKRRLQDVKDIEARIAALETAEASEDEISELKRTLTEAQSRIQGLSDFPLEFESLPQNIRRSSAKLAELEAAEASKVAKANETFEVAKANLIKNLNEAKASLEKIRHRIKGLRELSNLLIEIKHQEQIVGKTEAKIVELEASESAGTNEDELAAAKDALSKAQSRLVELSGMLIEFKHQQVAEGGETESTLETVETLEAIENAMLEATRSLDKIQSRTEELSNALIKIKDDQKQNIKKIQDEINKARTTLDKAKHRLEELSRMPMELIRSASEFFEEYAFTEILAIFEGNVLGGDDLLPFLDLLFNFVNPTRLKALNQACDALNSGMGANACYYVQWCGVAGLIVEKPSPYLFLPETVAEAETLIKINIHLLIEEGKYAKAASLFHLLNRKNETAEVDKKDIDETLRLLRPFIGAVIPEVAIEFLKTLDLDPFVLLVLIRSDEAIANKFGIVAKHSDEVVGKAIFDFIEATSPALKFETEVAIPTLDLSTCESEEERITMERNIDDFITLLKDWSTYLNGAHNIFKKPLALKMYKILTEPGQDDDANLSVKKRMEQLARIYKHCLENALNSKTRHRGLTFLSFKVFQNFRKNEFKGLWERTEAFLKSELNKYMRIVEVLPEATTKAANTTAPDTVMSGAGDVPVRLPHDALIMGGAGDVAVPAATPVAEPEGPPSGTNSASTFASDGPGPGTPGSVAAAEALSTGMIIAETGGTPAEGEHPRAGFAGTGSIVSVSGVLTDTRTLISEARSDYAAAAAQTDYPSSIMGGAGDTAMTPGSEMAAGLYLSVCPDRSSKEAAAPKMAGTPTGIDLLKTLPLDPGPTKPGATAAAFLDAHRGTDASAMIAATLSVSIDPAKSPKAAPAPALVMAKATLTPAPASEATAEALAAT